MEQLNISILEKIIDEAITNVFYLCKDNNIKIYLERYIDLTIGFLRLSLDTFNCGINESNNEFIDISFNLFMTFEKLIKSFGSQIIFNKQTVEELKNDLFKKEKELIDDVLRKYSNINFKYSNSYTYINLLKKFIYGNNNEIIYDEKISTNLYKYYNIKMNNFIEKFLNIGPSGLFNSYKNVLYNKKLN